MGDEPELPRQQQEHPGSTAAMEPRPRDSMADHRGSGLLRDRVALVTGGDSGIGRAVAVAFAYSPAQSLVDRGIRVNAVAPGPVWTPLIPATMSEEKVEKFGQQVPMSSAAHPDDIAPSYVFLASERLSGYYTGEVLAPIGGETLPG